MANLNDLKPIQTLKPFTKFCCSLGALPSSYLVSLTYEEQLLWLCDYLQNTIIPTVNNNGEAVTELQNLYVQLKNYVDNYFTNLDVQTEINNKLDQMVTDGTFDEILNQKLLSDINNQITTLSNLNKSTDDITLMMGDSYGLGTNPDDPKSKGWCDLLAEKLQLDPNNYIKLVNGGCGFIGIPSTNNFLAMLQRNINNIPNKNLVKTLIIGSGANDTAVVDTLHSQMDAFFTYVKQQFPNLQNISLFCLAYNNTLSQTIAIRREEYYAIFNLYKYATKYNCHVYIGASNVQRLDINMSSDHVHPSTLGYQAIATQMYNLLKSGQIDFNTVYFLTDPFTVTLNSGINYQGTAPNFYAVYYQDICSILMSGNMVIESPTPLAFTNHELLLGTYTPVNFRPSNYSLRIPMSGYVYHGSTNSYDESGFKLNFLTNGTVSLSIPRNLSNINAIYLMSNRIDIPICYV